MARMTSEERQILRSNQEKVEFNELKTKWEGFYEKMIRPTAA